MRQVLPAVIASVTAVSTGVVAAASADSDAQAIAGCMAMVIGTALGLTAWIVDTVRQTNREAVCAFDSGYELGRDKGYQEAMRDLTPDKGYRKTLQQRHTDLGRDGGLVVPIRIATRSHY